MGKPGNLVRRNDKQLTERERKDIQRLLDDHNGKGVGPRLNIMFDPTMHSFSVDDGRKAHTLYDIQGLRYFLNGVSVGAGEGEEAYKIVCTGHLYRVFKNGSEVQSPLLPAMNKEAALMAAVRGCVSDRLSVRFVDNKVV